MSSLTLGEVPAFDVADPNFSITSDEVHRARERSWYATTPYGIAVLRYEQMNRLLKHPNLRQGSVAWPAHNGVTEGPFADWWASWILNKEGDEHHRLRRLLNRLSRPNSSARWSRGSRRWPPSSSRTSPSPTAASSSASSPSPMPPG